MDSTNLFQQNVHKTHSGKLQSQPNSAIQHEVLEFFEKYSCLSAEQSHVLDFVARVLSESNADFSVKWYPHYRCALIINSCQGCNLVPVKKLSLLALQNHGLHVLNKCASKIERTTEAKSYAVCTLDQIEETNFEAFLDFLFHEYDVIVEEDKRNKEDRHKRANPGLVELMLKRAVQRANEQEISIHNIESGWSEVIDYTGGDWPLLIAVIEYLAACFPCSKSYEGHLHHQHFICHFQIWQLKKFKEDILSKIDDRNVDNRTVNTDVNNFMNFLEKIARETVDELTGIYSMEDVEKNLAEYREEVSEHIKKRWENYAQNYDLKLTQLTENTLDLEIAIEPLSVCPRHSNTDRTKMLAQQKNNIDDSPVIVDTEVDTVLQYIELLGKNGNKEDMLIFSLATNTVQNAVFEMTNNLSFPEFQTDISKLEKLLNKYREWNRKLIRKVCTKNSVKPTAAEYKKPESKRLVVEMLSNEMLVMWSVLSLVHLSLKQSVPLLDDFGVALNWQDVHFLVLSRRNALEAALNVSKYLKENTNSKKLFDLCNQENTFEFAHRYALSSSSLMRIWEQEKRDAEERQEDHWQEIQKKKATIARLRKELEQCEQKKHKLHSDLSKLSYWKSSERPQYEYVERQISNANNDIWWKNYEISNEKKAPDPVYQPLPKNEENALRVLFFLHMPTELQTLLRMTVSAQQILRPLTELCPHTALSVKEIEKIDEAMQKLDAKTNNGTNWSTYYARYSRKSASCCVIDMYSSSEIKEKRHIGYHDVELFHYPSDGIWHPDELLRYTLLYWNGGGFHLDQRFNSNFFNPFISVMEKHTNEYFTEKIDRNVQYAAVQYAVKLTDLSRSNKPIANQSNKPDCFNKQQWLSFANLRSFPNQQLRKLCASLSDRFLKLEEPIVHTLIRQTLYHVGEVTENNGNIFPTWKTDLLEGEFCSVITSELLDLGEELTEKPSQHMSMFILIEIARFVAQWHKDCAYVLRKFLAIIKKWIQECDSQIEIANVKDIPTLRAKKGVFYHYAVLCYSRGALSREEAGDLCELLVQAHNETRFEETTHYDGQLKLLVDIRCDMMSERIVQLLEYCETDAKNQMLSDAVRKILSDTPTTLEWENMLAGSHRTGCFKVFDDNGDLYGINLMNGIVLFNGVPLSSLPSSILRHDLFVRTFNDRNFETCLSGNVIKTAMPVKGRTYSFCLEKDKLTVKESCNIGGQDVELRLLNPLELHDEKSWGFSLPVILKENYSHWFCEEKQYVLFRGRYFLDRTVDFILEFKDNAWKCYRIPSYENETVWEKYLTGKVCLEDCYDKLVIVTSCLQNVFEKFEDPKFIHTFLPAKNYQLKIYHFPRFELQFELVQEGDGQKTLKSSDYAGYNLAPCQQFADTLWGFNRYLVLQQCRSAVEFDVKVIVPQGDVKVKNDGSVTVKNEQSSKAKLKVYTYDVHPRFRSLVARSIDARIHLADLYSACGNLLPEERMQMCGSEVAMQLVRRSWTNRPLNDKDYKKLNSMSKNSVDTPGLELLCYEVVCSSLQTTFLHTKEREEEDSYQPSFPSEVSIAYMHEEVPRNARNCLTAEEEFRVLGAIRSDHMKKKRFYENCGTTCVDGCVKKVSDLTHRYESLLQSVVSYSKRAKKNFIFDDDELNNDSNTSQLYSFIMSTLKTSHDAHFRLEDMEVGESFQSLFSFLLEEIKQKREESETYLFEIVSHVPEGCGVKGTNFRILRSANLYPTLTCEDLVKCMVDRNWIHHFNPFLSKTCSDTVFHNIAVWMKLCVLEDKISRLVHLSSKTDHYNSEHLRKAARLQVLQELSVNRTWSTNEHPQWLVFEVVCGLQIRPIQYTVAKSMIDGVENNALGPVTQLNMGEGKTRVILPMLAMHWRNSEKLVRLNVLSPLLQESGEYMHNVLSASIIGIPVLHFPFNRDVKLTLDRARTLGISLKHCEKIGGVIICAPEHRQSLKLKWHELQQKKNQKEVTEICDMLEKFDSFSYLDILDEVDEILRTKNKLIYAIGAQEQLSSRSSRVHVLQGLLAIVGLSSKSEGKEIRRLLSGELVCQGDVGLKNGKFQEFRILPGENFGEVRTSLLRELAEKLIENPPYELRELAQLESRLDDVIEYVTQPERGHFNSEDLDETCIDDVLALRGFLANDLFVHCLMKRNRVDYGVNREPGARRKLMAVPFHACETPALRAEFGHPDCALMYTCLSYYYDGLNHQQVEQAFHKLLLLGESAQEAIYKTWYQQSCTIMTDVHQSALDVVKKLDLSNTILVSNLVQYFAFNTLTINFWLNSCVFPLETMQFPERLEATAWDLSHNSHYLVAGFSGTNDERIIMPSSLQWVEQNTDELESTSSRTIVDPKMSLIATDGKMLQLLLEASFLEIIVDEGLSQWKTLLDVIVGITQSENEGSTHYTRALIDAGALMAGAPNNTEVARYLAQNLGPRYMGVVYFSIAENGWWVRDKRECSWPKHSSPIHEKDAFVYFDESRTRGADMKLNVNSCAVLTLGPQMCKDKLMQAAGRMRMLEHGQKLLLVAAQDVTSQIKDSNGLDATISGGCHVTSLHVLKWVMTNTVKNIIKWLPEWAIQGGQFIRKEGRPDLAQIPDTTKLNAMYGHELEEKPICDVWKAKRNAFFNGKEDRGEETLGLRSENTLKDIDKRIETYGSEFSSKMGSNMDEECERELEKELELEIENQKEIEERNPRGEKDWNPALLAGVGSASSFGKNIYSVDKLKNFVETKIFYNGHPIKESLTSDSGVKFPDNIYGTHNFFLTCEEDSSNINRVTSSNEYLRLVDFFLIFSNGDIVLLSEREADKVLEFWRKTKCETFSLVNLTYARKREENGRIKFETPVGNSFAVTHETLTALAFFQGQVMFSKEENQNNLKSMLASAYAKLIAPTFCQMRGLGFSYSRSDLELICNRYKIN